MEEIDKEISEMKDRSFLPTSASVEAELRKEVSVAQQKLDTQDKLLATQAPPTSNHIAIGTTISTAPAPAIVARSP